MGTVGMPTNPTVSIGGCRGGGNPKIERNYYDRIVFRAQNFLTYKEGQEAENIEEIGADHTFYFYRLDQGEGEVPEYITPESWSAGLAKNPQGFVTPVDSVMPKLLIPNVLDYVDNGALGFDEPEFLGIFNWEILNEIAESDIGKFSKVDVGEPKFYKMVYRDESNSQSVVGLVVNPVAGEGDLADGAFCIMLNVVPTMQYQINPEENRGWQVDISFGEVQISLFDGGMLVNVGGTITRANLSDAKAKEVPPQFERMTLQGGIPYCIVVYPVWNGIVVCNGIQDVTNTIGVSSTYCQKIPGIGIMSEGMSSFFNPKSPSSIVVEPINVEMNGELTVVLSNCTSSMVYTPVYFSKEANWDDLFVGITEDSEDVSYKYTAYPIYCVNKGAGTPSEQTSKEGKEISDDTSIMFFPWSIESIGRHSAEIFGYILHTCEITNVNIANSNGAFGGLPGKWKEYITNVSVSVGLSNTSGTITVDKYGAVGDLSTFAGQSVGGISLSVGGQGGGQIFSGLAWGVGDDVSGDSGGWTVNLVGLEKKLEDIILINAPFFDGFEADVVAGWLCSYAGVRKEGSLAGILPSSQDITVPVVDFSSGTSVMEALRMICEMVNGIFVCEHGAVVFYNLGDDGLPESTGTIDVADNKIQNINHSPDFEDLRNEVILFSMRRVGTATNNIENINVQPQMLIKKVATTPNIPWSKPLVEGLKGYLTFEELERVMDLRARDVSRYEALGQTTISGSANVRLFNTFRGLYVYGYTHNIDLQSKTFTTSLTFGGGGD